ncbi:MAG: glycine cleavage system protein GcvH [Polyangiaceae bacterium]
MSIDQRELRYLQSHEWARQDGDHVVVGITDFAVKELQDLVFIALPKLGSRVARGKRMGEIESVKAVVDIFSPVDGTVAAVNAAVDKDVQVVAGDPFGAGWMVRVKPDAAPAAALEGLLDADAYARHTAAGGH